MNWERKKTRYRGHSLCTSTCFVQVGPVLKKEENLAFRRSDPLKKIVLKGIYTARLSQAAGIFYSINSMVGVSHD